MKIETTRFGPVEVDPQRVINMPKGMLGFPLHKQFALIATSDASPFYWLQSVSEPSLAFVVCDPKLFVADYQVTLRGDDLELLDVAGEADVTALIVCNKVDDLLTGNLQGPIAVNPTSRVAKQLVLSEKRYSTRHPLMKLANREMELVSKTA